jgi:hypothetical protein
MDFGLGSTAALAFYYYTCLLAIPAHGLSFGLGGLRTVWPLGGL